ncbi:hypothetical protein N7466_000284 [Penicillium verhagenii]|uniref:uncharacterized protein n=1 Tax=Penicillium verhagenii TaxID=1562060 RepID=UPI0025459E5E|nr:uncharacterized protein N7466_000284 [Penicillium verhagenii]KAJ5947269.1 hypothetical protein N7466_000284 [Penicillium verhagenii]
MSQLSTWAKFTLPWTKNGGLSRPPSFTRTHSYTIAVIFILCWWRIFRSHRHARSIYELTWRQKLSLVCHLPILQVANLVNRGLNIIANVSLWYNGISVSNFGVQESAFTSEDDFSLMLDKIGGFGHRSTGSEAHEEMLQWLEKELVQIPGIVIHKDAFGIKKWETADGCTLQEAGEILIDDTTSVPIAGVVPYSLPTLGQTGDLIFLPRAESIANAAVKGKVILRDFPSRQIPYALGRICAYHATPDLDTDLLSLYDRPGLADEPLHVDLLEAGTAGAAGVIFLFDIVGEQVESYFDPHKGTHYLIPAMYVGAEESLMLRQFAHQGASATLKVKATVSNSETRNLRATLPGQINERVIYLSHTDGNTYIQENGPVALLALARYFAQQPLANRRRTLEFSFNTGHLHISREGSLRHAQQLDQIYEEGSIALVIPMEHLGSREIEAVKRSDGKPGRELRYSGRGELMLWCVGPSRPVVKSIWQAVQQRGLDRVVVTRGVSKPNRSQVPTFTSFGGIGGYYHNMLLPTTSLISGPWSLWAPKFGKEAVDIKRFRNQTLALGDIYLSIDHLSRETIAGDYITYRNRRVMGVPPAQIVYPPETASSELSDFGSNSLIY